ncbi:hypothetical protein [Pseudonocardia acaciae]|uniref:hypothetical protein n=1 Tax=Pseudonocardia acaciae TaxID=551276 RepID=UPI0004905AB8|nr:hypothetical protein [Pseudonocardia acaciae]
MLSERERHIFGEIQRRLVAEDRRGHDVVIVLVGVVTAACLAVVSAIVVAAALVLSWFARDRHREE